MNPKLSNSNLEIVYVLLRAKAAFRGCFIGQKQLTHTCALLFRWVIDSHSIFTLTKTKRDDDRTNHVAE